jgi:hypothetical protein
MPPKPFLVEIISPFPPAILTFDELKQLAPYSHAESVGANQIVFERGAERQMLCYCHGEVGFWVPTLWVRYVSGQIGPGDFWRDCPH